MSDREDDFIAKARRERQLLQDQGARDLGGVSTESLGELTPTQTPQTRRLFPGGMPYSPSEQPTDTPAATVSEGDLRKAVQAAQDAFPTDSNQPNMLRPGVNQGHWSQAQIPSPEETKVEMARRPQLGHSGSPLASNQSTKLDHSPQHETEQDSAKRPQLGSSPASQQAGTPLEAQRKTEQEATKTKLQADRAGTLTASDQAVSQTTAADKAAEQAKVQQQAPPTQEH